MDGTLTFLEAARVIGLGLNLNLFNRDEVAVWADARIAEDEKPPVWLLELATSRHLWPYDAAKLVLAHVPDIATDLACGVMLGLLPDLETIPTDKLHATAVFIYRLIRDACNAEWSHKILCDADQITDQFALIKDRIVQDTVESMRLEMEIFVMNYALPEKALSLHPVRIHLAFSK